MHSSKIYNKVYLNRHKQDNSSRLVSATDSSRSRNNIIKPALPYQFNFDIHIHRYLFASCKDSLLYVGILNVLTIVNNINVLVLLQIFILKVGREKEREKT